MGRESCRTLKGWCIAGDLRKGGSVGASEDGAIIKSGGRVHGGIAKCISQEQARVPKCWRNEVLQEHGPTEKWGSVGQGKLQEHGGSKCCRLLEHTS